MVWENEVIFTQRIWIWEASGMKSFSGIPKHKFYATTCAFTLNYFLATSMTNWAQIFTGLLFQAYWETTSEDGLGPVSNEISKQCLFCYQIAQWNNFTNLRYVELICYCHNQDQSLVQKSPNPVLESPKSFVWYDALTIVKSVPSLFYLIYLD